MREKKQEDKREDKKKNISNDTRVVVMCDQSRRNGEVQKEKEGKNKKEEKKI